MPGSYHPVDSAVLGAPYNISLLAQRDVALQVPVNYITTSSISVSAACFAHNRFESNALTQCLSNLISVGYRRLVLDIYWDAGRHEWTFCPAQLPTAADPDPSKSSIANEGTMTSIGGPGASSGTPTTRSTPIAVTEQGTMLTDAGFARRQVLETITIPLDSSSSSVLVDTVTLDPQDPPAATATPLSSPIPTSPGETLVSVGPYICDPDLSLSLVTSLYYDYLQATDNTLEAQINYLLFNIHAAAPFVDAEGPALAPDDADLPSTPDLIGHIFNSSSAYSYLYTPTILQQQRANPRASLLQLTNTSRPDYSYYTENVLDGGPAHEGWPSESLMENMNVHRLILGYDRIDPQMDRYNVNAEGAFLFDHGMLQVDVDATLSAAGVVESGCFYNPSVDSLADSNNSFAFTGNLPASIYNSPDLRVVNSFFPALTNISSCGISTQLNETLLNATADTDVVPYRNFALANIWSWAPGEPLDDSSITNSSSSSSSSNGNESDDTNRDFRCAIMDATSGAMYSGRWHAAFCQNRQRGVCRSSMDPHAWTLSKGGSAVYSQLNDDCPTNYSFAVPRTALENRYALAAAQRASLSTVFLNINSLDVEGCWVAGVNSTCPYVRQDTQGSEAVIVPTVAAVIIFLIAILLLITKCSSNRRNSRRKRKGEGEWDYEGVPS